MKIYLWEFSQQKNWDGGLFKSTSQRLTVLYTAQFDDRSTMKSGGTHRGVIFETLYLIGVKEMPFYIFQAKRYPCSCLYGQVLRLKNNFLVINRSDPAARCKFVPLLTNGFEPFPLWILKVGSLRWYYTPLCVCVYNVEAERWGISAIHLFQRRM